MSLRTILEPHVKYAQNLPHEISQSLFDYAGAHYEEINLFLHYGNEYTKYLKTHLIFTDEDNFRDEIPKGTLQLDEIKMAINNIDTAFANSPPLEEPLVLFRGIRSYNEKYFTNKAYMSTSLNIDTAAKFVGDHNCCVMVITIPIGSKILAIRSIKTRAPMIEKEDEILLDRGSIMVVGYGKEENSGIHLIYCVYVPSEAIPMETSETLLNEDEKETVEDVRMELIKKHIIQDLLQYKKSSRLDKYMAPIIKEYGIEDTPELREELKRRLAKSTKQSDYFSHRF